MSPERVKVILLAAAAHFRPVHDAEKIGDARRRYAIPEGDYLLSIANLEPRKNLSHLIHSFLELCAAQPDRDLSLVLVGSKGWMYEDILAVSSNSVFSSRVIFTGHIPDADLSTIYSGAVAFVYPSLYEGFGLPPLEAMQCGVPVITSNTTSLPEVVGDAAITVDPSDGDALCDAILRVLSDTQLRADLSRKGLARAQDFSWARCAGQTVELYRTAIGHP
jgi:glycosyltransferase involved in cell wall biosynthesis